MPDQKENSMTSDEPSVSSGKAITSSALELKKLELEEKKDNREYEIHLKELAIKESELRRSKWSNSLVLAVVAAFIAAAGNGYISWLHGANQLTIESTKYSSEKELLRQRAEADRILEAIKDVTPDKAAEKIRFLIDVGFVTDPNRQAALEEYLKRKEATSTGQSTGSPITEQYSTGWLGGGNNQADQCRIGRAVISQKYPGKTILLVSSSEQSKKDLFGRVEYKYFCTFQIQ